MVRTGLDRLVEQDFVPLKGLRVGVLVNQSAVDRSYTHLIEHLARRPEINLIKIFAPEHGLWGGPQDMEGVTQEVEPLTGKSVVNLYDGTVESLSPRREDLADLDLLVVDLPDIGARYYTYAQTMALSMSVAGQVKCKVLVLDRPNPIGGAQIEGSPLKGRYRSFCGMLPVPQRHGLTLGELALMYQSGFGRTEEEAYPACRCELEILKVEGWNRKHYLDEAKGRWVIPSPNMPTLETAVVYPGMCLFEGTNISEGRGTTMPFLYVGAPFIDPFKWRELALKENIALEGAQLRPVSFIPKFQKWANQNCHGVQLHVTDRNSFNSFNWALALISSLRKLAPSEFKWRTEPYEFIDNILAIDLLYGSDRFRKCVDSTGELSSLQEEITEFEQWFSSSREPYLLY
jgi:uncharacterized protein YbbC (DUF1343 family)